MKYSYVMFVRDKAPWVAQTVRSILAQTHKPMDIYLSDQGSTDGTLDVIKKTVNGYNGPNRVHILQCPKTERRGRAGLIDHINWLHDTIEGDYWITTAGDDLDHPMRVAKTVKAIDGLDKVPLFFGTAQFFMNNDLDVQGVTAKPQESKWVEPDESLIDMVGGSSSGAWSRKLLDDFGPMPDTALVDLYMPFCAAVMESFYFLNDHLHSYVWRPDPKNTGLQGLSDNHPEHEDKERIRELVQFELVGNMLLMTKVVHALYEADKENPRLDRLLQFMYAALMTQASGWSDARYDLTRARIRPAALPY